MSIRKVSDLPNIKSVDYSLANLSSSLLEVSYRVSADKAQYASRYMRFDDMFNAISAIWEPALKDMMYKIIEDYLDIDGSILITEDKKTT